MSETITLTQNVTYEERFNFLLVICDVTLEEVIKRLTNFEATLVGFVMCGDSGGYPEFIFETKTYEQASAVVDEFYGPDATNRDTNQFYIYGDED
jgi:hypothetical protein